MTRVRSSSPRFYFRHMQLENYAAGQWIAGSGKQAELLDAITSDLIGTTSSGGLDFAYSKLTR